GCAAWLPQYGPSSRRDVRGRTPPPPPGQVAGRGRCAPPPRKPRPRYGGQAYHGLSQGTPRRTTPVAGSGPRGEDVRCPPALPCRTDRRGTESAGQPRPQTTPTRYAP